MSPAVADELGLVEYRPGVIVIEVKPGAYAGRFVRQGDMIVAVNGQDVKNVADLKKKITGGVVERHHQPRRHGQHRPVPLTRLRAW